MTEIVPLVQFTFDENDPKFGLKAISLVKEPAIESDFQFFEAAKPEDAQPQYFKLEGYEGVVHGLAMIPNKPMLRFDENKNPYYGYFTADTIKKLVKKFHKELQNNNISADHSGKPVEGYLTESFLIDDEYKLASVKAKGIKEPVMGSFYVKYQIEDMQTFQRVVDGELKGFSIEAFLHKFLRVNNNKQNTIVETMNKFIEKFEALLNEMKTPVALEAPVAPVSASTAPAAEKKFETAKIFDGVDSVEWAEIGSPVTIILPDGSRKPAAEGSYITDTQKELVVDAAGNLVEIRSIEKEITEDAAAAMIPVEQAQANVLAEAAKFQKVIEDANAEKIALSAEITALKAEIEVLKKAPLGKPVLVTKDKADFSKVDFSKLTEVEKIAIKNGFELPTIFSKK